MGMGRYVIDTNVVSEPLISTGAQVNKAENLCTCVGRLVEAQIVTFAQEGGVEKMTICGQKESSHGIMILIIPISIPHPRS